MRFKVKAPSNIALIKYMGKKSGTVNQPENASLSMTLKNLCTSVTVEPSSETSIYSTVKLDEKSVSKIKTHLGRLDQKLPAFLELKSTPVSIHTQNTFPAGAGIASSASSYAGITMAYALSQAKSPEKFYERIITDLDFRSQLASLSREGSGSSCRSFFGPFVEWDDQRVQVVESKLEPLIDLVVIVDSAAKTVSSSEAHERVKTSPLWESRTKNVTQRFHDMKDAIAVGNIADVATLAYEDAMEMHELFHTSKTPFSYMTPMTHAVLDFLAFQKIPEMIVTLDAGPNVHILLPKLKAFELRQKLAQSFPMFAILDDRSSEGPTIEGV